MRAKNWKRRGMKTASAIGNKKTVSAALAMVRNSRSTRRQRWFRPVKSAGRPTEHVDTTLRLEFAATGVIRHSRLNECRLAKRMIYTDKMQRERDFSLAPNGNLTASLRWFGAMAGRTFEKILKVEHEAQMTFGGWISWQC